MLDPKEERQYEQLRKLAQGLHIPIPEAFWTFEVFDRNGKLIQRHRQRSHSWVRNAYNHLVTQLMAINAGDSPFGAGKINIKNTAGALIDYDFYITCTHLGDPEDVGKAYRGAAGVDTSGIQVGSGTNAESLEDYKLQTQIANGAGAGQLSHTEGDPPVKGYSAPVYSVQHVRYFNNNSGGAVDVNEVGIVCSGAVGATFQKWLQAHDKLPATVSVPDTGQLKVTYTLQLTYPA
ncbi:hypothetical protein ES705_20478 [subsurface metagenome]